MNSTCSACTKYLHIKDTIQCSKCDTKFHLDCVNIGTKNKRQLSDIKSKWVCPICSCKTPKSDNSNIPIRSLQIHGDSDNLEMRKQTTSVSPSPSTQHNCNCPSMEAIYEMIRNEIRSSMSQAMDDSFTTRLNELRDEIRSWKESMEFMNRKFEEIQSECVTQTKNMNFLMKENEKLTSNIQSLSQRLNQMEQLSRSNNLEIQCVPEFGNENIINLVMQLAKTIKYPLNENEIFYCSRIAKFNSSSTRPRSLVVKFSTPRLRDNILAAVIKFNKDHPDEKLNSGHLGIGGNQKTSIFVVEHLSPEYKLLHAATRQKARELQYKYVWVRSGRIFVRKSDSSSPIFIRDNDTLSKLV